MFGGGEVRRAEVETGSVKGGGEVVWKGLPLVDAVKQETVVVCRAIVDSWDVYPRIKSVWRCCCGTAVVSGGAVLSSNFACSVLGSSILSPPGVRVSESAVSWKHIYRKGKPVCCWRGVAVVWPPSL